MAYATLADLKARAGALAQAWGENTEPGNTDLNRILDQVAAEIDAFIGAAGFTSPTVDPIAVGSLTGLNADKALLIALDATYPGDAANVQELRASIQKRVDAYDAAIAAGDLAALVYLSETAAGAAQGGAGDFWTVDGVEDYYWSIYGGVLGGSRWATDQFGVAPTQGPAFRKGMRL